MEQKSNVFTVSQINEYIKMVLDKVPLLGNVYVKGEISNFTNHYKTGHFYLTLKDENGLIRAVMFKSSASKLMFEPEDGMKVIAHGRIASYVRDGQYQLYIDSMEPDGIGALYIAYEQLKRKLEKEGLFDASLKKALPKIPSRIGIITSPTGAAVRDIINITGRRFPFAELVLYPSLVQGDGAAEQLINGLKYFNEAKNVDVIILGRGGGSIEDLWAFNNEELARTVAASELPVISAVGHENDFTICDFVADRRAPTPSAAAELSVPDTIELKRKFANVTAHMLLLISKKTEFLRNMVKNCAESRALTSPKNIIDDKQMIVLSLGSRLDSAMKISLGNKRSDFVKNTAKLEALNPMSIISRGYSAVFDEDGKVINSVEQTSIGSTVKLRLSDGTVTGTVNKVEKTKE